MSFLSILTISFFLLFSSYANAEQRCFIASHNNHLIVEEGNCNKHYPPCSTFKIAISLMGFDTGILIDTTHPTWAFKPGYVDWLEQWRQPHNPTSWLANSCVWYSQIITKKLGEKRFSSYVKQLNYGNKDVAGDKGVNNGLTHCWLSSSLTIAPREQIQFLEKLVRNRLPVSLKAHNMTKKAMFVEDLPNDWKLYGKTGNGSQLSSKRSKIQDKQVGWFVGFVSKKNHMITFVYLIADDEKKATYASLRAKLALKKRLNKLLETID